MWDELAKGAVEGLVKSILSGKASGQLEAQSFVLRDARGHGRAVLAMLDGGPALTLLSDNGEVKAVVGLDEAGPYLQFWGAAGKTSFIARMDGDEADVSFYDGGQVQRATLGLDSGGPTLQMRDAGGRCRAQLVVDADDGPSLTVYDEGEQPQAEFRCPD
jgi:hypothetical protein